VVAAQLGRGQVVDERHQALGTSERLTAVAAQDEGRGAAAVDEEDRLAACAQPGEAIGQGLRQD
jgi:hypothetical protein